MQIDMEALSMADGGANDEPDNQRTDSTEFSIADHGLRFTLYGPPNVLDGVAERRAAVLRTLEILAPVVRPLALEVTFGPLEPETLAVEVKEARRIAVQTLPDGIANVSDFARPAELQHFSTLDADVIAETLTPPHSSWDIATVRASVTAARVTATNLTVEQSPSRQVPELELDGERWVVGPLDVHGLTRLPPIGLTWSQHYGDVILEVEAFWTLWWNLNSDEHAGLRAVEEALLAAGFPAPPE